MRTFKHSTKDWKAEEHPVVPNSYKVTKQVEQGYVSYGFPAELIEDSEDWIEQIEKDYEILYYGHWVGRKEKEIIKVKRLPDEFIVSMGDEVENKNHPRFNGKVYEIEEMDGNIFVYYAPKRGCDLLKDICKTRKPILKTEDGVDLFEGDKAYRIFVTQPISVVTEVTVSVKSYIGISYMKYFSTREAAEEHRLWNYRGLSLNDIRETIYTTDMGEAIAADLEKVVKSRLS